MISRPFCAFMLGTCIVAMPVTAWMALENVRHGMREAAGALLVCVGIQAAVGALNLFLLLR